jgi:hypothetical protein
MSSRREVLQSLIRLTHIGPKPILLSGFFTIDNTSTFNISTFQHSTFPTSFEAVGKLDSVCIVTSESPGRAWVNPHFPGDYEVFG